MAEQAELSALVGWAQAMARRLLPWVLPALLVLLAMALRFENLLYPQYYIFSPDSNFFHWFAQRIMDGQGAPPNSPALFTVHSGLAYPLAYMGNAISFAFNLSHAQALTIVCKVFPPVLGIVSLIVVYLVSVRLSNRRVGLFAAFTWACMFPSVAQGAAGFVQRDGFTTLLLMLGVAVFYLSKDWHLRVGSRDLAWLISGLSVLVIMAMLYVSWSIVGSVILLALIAACFVVKLVIEFISRARTDRGTKLRIASALGTTNWKVFAFTIVGSGLTSLVYRSHLSSWFNFLWYGVTHRGVQSTVSELGGLGPSDFLIFYLFLIPIVIGLVIAFYSVRKSRSGAAVLLCTWFVALIVLSVFARRILVFAAAPAAILSGLGLTFVWGWAKLDRPRALNRIGAAAIVLVLAVTSFGTTVQVATRTFAPDAESQDALAYLREQTPQQAVIMTQWSYGYWILDLAQRRPFEDNGYYGYDGLRSYDVGVAYSTSDPSAAARAMQSGGADYLVFFQGDSGFAPTILGWAGLPKEKSFPEDSLFSRSIDGNFTSGGGLQVVYRSQPNSEVVILKLIQSEQH